MDGRRYERNMSLLLLLHLLHFSSQIKLDNNNYFSNKSNNKNNNSIKIEVSLYDFSKLNYNKINVGNKNNDISLVNNKHPYIYYGTSKDFRKKVHFKNSNNNKFHNNKIEFHNKIIQFHNKIIQFHNKLKKQHNEKINFNISSHQIKSNNNKNKPNNIPFSNNNHRIKNTHNSNNPTTHNSNNLTTHNSNNLTNHNSNNNTHNSNNLTNHNSTNNTHNRNKPTFKNHRHLSKRSYHHHYTAYNDPDNGFCRSISDCAIGQNLICLMEYDGCLRGVCACNGSHSVMKGGRCLPVSYGGGPCSSTSPICGPHLSCVGGICRCPRDHYLTNDKTRCLKEGTRLVGESCSPPLQASNKQTCVRRKGNNYSTDDVSCSSETSTCRCDDGFKPHQHSCLSRRIGEWGCVTTHHCGGGAVCLDGRCVCPTNYEADTALYKCIKKGAVSNLEMGEKCDEVNETRYCSPGLVCYRCSPHEHEYKCLQYHYGSTGASSLPCRPNIIIIITFTIFLVVMMMIPSTER